MAVATLLGRGDSPQAKGRVERAFGTLQDRLVKVLRLARISSIEAASAWLPDFLASHNARFGREPADAQDLHRTLTAATIWPGARDGP